MSQGLEALHAAATLADQCNQNRIAGSALRLFVPSVKRPGLNSNTPQASCLSLSSTQECDAYVCRSINLVCACLSDMPFAKAASASPS